MMMLRTLLLAIALAASSSALTTPHHLRRSAHADLAARRREAVPAPAPLAGTESAPVLLESKKAKRQACKQRSTPATTPAVANVAPPPTPAPASTPAPAPAQASAPAPAPAPAAAPANVAPAPQDSQSSSPPPAPAAPPPPPAPAAPPPQSGSDLGGVSDVVGVDLSGGMNSGGDGTFYDVGLGSCGITNDDSQMLVAVSWELYDNFPGATGNPNNNPICGKTITASFNGNSVTVPVRDRCTGCAPKSLDFSPAAFQKLADPAIGRIHGIEWSFT